MTPQEEINFRGDFARYMNFVIEDTPVWVPDSGHMLWDELMTILNNSIFAESSLSEEENKLLDEAIDFLINIEVSDGMEIPVDALAVRRYYEYRQAFESARQTYLNEESTINCASGPEGDNLRQQWEAYRKKELFDITEKAKQKWMSLGQKEIVENYQSIKSNLETKKYVAKYKQAYLKEIELSQILDLNSMGIGFYTTFYSPIDAFDTDFSWNTITLNSEEINELVKNAPVELKEIFWSNNEKSDIIEVWLEYKEVAVLRPWFKPEFFTSKCWKLANNSLVSDGETPRKGIIPAYITNMIVARRVKVKRKKTPTSKILPIMQVVFAITGRNKPLAVFKKIESKQDNENPQIKEIKPRMMTIMSELKPLKPSRIFERKIFSVFQQIKQTFRINFYCCSSRTDYPTNTRKKLTDALTYQRIKLLNAVKTIEPAKPTLTSFEKPDNIPKNDQSIDTYDLDGIRVLAFVCKRVPKSPNPDASLTWSK